jgi:CheY-like chemotaxis protein
MLIFMVRTKTVVHVEDNEDVAEMLAIVFDECPVNWIIAPTGADGLRLARELHPDLVVLDLMLPDMSGRDVFLQMKDDPQLERMPISFPGTNHPSSPIPSSPSTSTSSEIVCWTCWE